VWQFSSFMPGIAGWIASPGQDARPVVQQMLQAMTHEPWQVSGCVCVEPLGLAVAWVCHPGSFADCQPIWNAERTVGLAFAGEHFSDGDSQSAPVERQLGPALTAAKLSADYERLGGRFFEKLNGWFSGLLWDLRERKAVLFNDRYGLNRIYWHEDGGGFYFSSEAKALLRVLPRLRRLHPAGWSEFFELGGPIQERSIFSGISLLPGGSAWTFRLGEKEERTSYFKKEAWEQQPPLDADQYYLRLRETLTRVVPRYLHGRQKVALSLTGGLDTRVILACAKPEPGALPCYTYGGMLREAQDVVISRRIAAECQQPYQVIALESGFFREFSALAARSVFVTDGAFDVSGAVGLFTNRAARAVAPIRLTGNYGSEILRGNVVFRPHALEGSLFHGDFLPALQKARASYAEERRVSRTSFIAFKQVPWHHYGRLAMEQSQLTQRSPYLDNELVALAYQAPVDAEVNRALACRLITEWSPALARIATDFGYLGSGDLVRRCRVGLQWWVHRTDYVFDYGMPPWLVWLDRAFRPLHVERLFLGRHKYAHFRIWYRDQLAEMVKETLLDPQTLNRPYLNGRFVEKMVIAHVNGHGNYTTEIHKLLTSEMIERHLIAQS